MAAERRAHGHQDARAEKALERQCAVTRRHGDDGDLLRFVRSPEGEIVPDLEHCLPGRGVWVGGTRETVEKAVKTKAFDRSLKSASRVAPDLADRIEAMLAKRVGATLALANKAGLVVPGFQQVDSALVKGPVSALLHGSDAAEDGAGKLDRKFKAIQGDFGRPAPIVAVLTIEQLSLAMGRPSVVHAALLPGGLTERFLREAERLQRYRSPAVASNDAFSKPESKLEG